MHTKILILDGSQPMSTINERAFQEAALVAVTNPKRRNLFRIMKARYLPPHWAEGRALGNITRDSLNQLIGANLQ